MVDRRSAALAIILVSYFMIVLDISIVITGLPKILESLSFSATGLSWVQNAYTLAFGGLLLLGARAGDILGRRRIFVAGLALFTVASLGVGLAQSAAWLLAARALQGVGAACVDRSAPRQSRPMALSGPGARRCRPAAGRGCSRASPRPRPRTARCRPRWRCRPPAARPGAAPAAGAATSPRSRGGGCRGTPGRSRSARAARRRCRP